MRLVRRAALAACLAVAVGPAGPAAAAAQTVAETRPEGAGSVNWRRWAFAAIGAVVGVVPALLAEDRGEEGGTCVSQACQVAVAAAMGTTVGFLIGRERDQAAALRRAAGPTLRLRSQAVALDLVPEALSAFGGHAVVVGREGLAAIGPDRVARPRAAGVRGIAGAAALPAHDALLAATAAGLFAFPLGGADAAGRMVLNDASGVVEPLAPDQVLFGTSELLRRLRLTGRGPAVDVREEARTRATGPSNDVALAPAQGVVWVLAGERLAALSAGGLEELGALTLPAPGRTVSVDGDRALVAAGNEGLFLVDAARPEAPRLLARIRGIQFAFDAVLQGTLAYVAAGGVGLLVVDLSDPAHPRTVGVARDLGFVNGVEAGDDGRIYTLDRAGRRLLLVEPHGPAGPASR